MGKSMPAATAILPTLAAAAGARAGFRRGGRKMARVGGELEQMQGVEAQIQDRMKQRDNIIKEAAKKDQSPAPGQLEELRNEMKDLKIQKERISEKGQVDMLWERLKYGAGAAAVGGVTGQGLESIRRSMGTEN